MRKLSTAPVKEIDELQRVPTALGLGDRSSHCVLDGVFESVATAKRQYPHAMDAAFGMPRSRFIETWMHSPWISRLLIC